jgi:hypothetical protein
MKKSAMSVPRECVHAVPYVGKYALQGRSTGVYMPAARQK